MEQKATGKNSCLLGEEFVVGDRGGDISFLLCSLSYLLMYNLLILLKKYNEFRKLK